MEAESLTGVKSYNQGITGDSLGQTAQGVKSVLDSATKRELGILRRLADGLKKVARKIIAMNALWLNDINFFVKQTSTNTNITSKVIASFPVIISNKKVEATISRFVADILYAKQKGRDTSTLESRIDLFVYHLYGLSYDEVLIVDPETPITREEYEK